MKPWVKVLITTLVLGITAFLAEPNGPLGAFWAPHPGVSEATGIQIPLFLILGLVEALTFGVGVSFLIFGYPLVKAIGPASESMSRAAHLSIAWFLINWWPHDSLHIHNGVELNGLLAIDYAFHITLIIAGLILACFFVTLLRQERAVSR